MGNAKGLLEAFEELKDISIFTIPMVEIVKLYYEGKIDDSRKMSQSQVYELALNLEKIIRDNDKRGLLSSLVYRGVIDESVFNEEEKDYAKECIIEELCYLIEFSYNSMDLYEDMTKDNNIDSVKMKVINYRMDIEKKINDFSKKYSEFDSIFKVTVLYDIQEKALEANDIEKVKKYWIILNYMDQGISTTIKRIDNDINELVGDNKLIDIDECTGSELKCLLARLGENPYDDPRLDELGPDDMVSVMTVMTPEGKVLSYVRKLD